MKRFSAIPLVVLTFSLFGLNAFGQALIIAWKLLKNFGKPELARS